MTLIFLILAAAGGYLLGSIPFGLLLSRAFGLGDVRQIGSGNIGATNVLRTGSKTAAALTLLLDGGKAALAVVLARHWGGELAAQITAAAALIGHCLPIWLGFKGGKGVATFLGLTLALYWPVGLAACATWLLTAAAFRISSASALAATALAPLWALLMGHPDLTVPLLLIAAFVWWRHSENIARLRAGTEPRIGGS